MTFINSDPDVLRAFVAWLDLLDFPRALRTYRVSIHESADLASAETYWTRVVDAPVDEFGLATIKRHRPKTRRLNTGAGYYGCLTVQLRRSRELYQAIEGCWSTNCARGCGCSKPVT